MIGIDVSGNVMGTGSLYFPFFPRDQQWGQYTTLKVNEVRNDQEIHYHILKVTSRET